MGKIFNIVVIVLLLASISLSIFSVMNKSSVQEDAVSILSNCNVVMALPESSYDKQTTSCDNICKDNDKTCILALASQYTSNQWDTPQVLQGTFNSDSREVTEMINCDITRTIQKQTITSSGFLGEETTSLRCQCC